MYIAHSDCALLVYCIRTTGQRIEARDLWNYLLQLYFHQEQEYHLEDAYNNSLARLFGTKKTNQLLIRWSSF